MFLYLMYDVLQRREAALGNFLSVKQKDWERAQAAISSLTFDRLAAAARSIHDKGTHDDPTIAVLERQIQNIASQIPQSFARMKRARQHLQALFVSLRMPAF